MPPKKRTTKYQGNFYSFGYLRNGAGACLDAASEVTSGGAYMLVSCTLMSAFAVEAHLNHVGSAVVPAWDEVERPLGPKAKLGLISGILDFKPDHSQPPFQSFLPLFKLRNLLVHGKDEEVVSTHNDEPASRFVSLNPEWLDNITTGEQTKRMYDDACKMMEALQLAAGLPKQNLYRIASAMSWSR